MNFFKRATTSIFRQPVKFIVLLLLVFTLSTVMSGAISAVTAIGNTEASLRRQMRPIVSLDVDDDAVFAAWEEAGGYIYEFRTATGGGSEMRGDWPTIMPITSEMVKQIAQLPQVEFYHYSITAWFNTQLIEYLPENAETMTGGSMCIWDEEAGECFDNLISENSNQKTIHGTSDYEPLEMQEGLIELAGGSTFENFHSASAYPALVSTGFAQVNDFQVGSTFTLRSEIQYVNRDHLDLAVASWDDLLFDTMEYEFEIVGLFEVIPVDTDDEWFEAQRQRELANRIFTINEATAAALTFEMEANIAAAEVAGEEPWFDPDDWGFMMETNLMLTDPLELESFTVAVADYLPEFWIVNDLTGTFDQFSTSMETLNDIADGVLLAAAGASVLILSLLITLFLKDRRHEIGIYLALGEKKLKIILQVLFEVLATALIGITAAIFVGNIISANISREMIRTELARPASDEDPWGWRDPWISGIADLGFGGNLSHEEMIEVFDTSLNANAIVLLYVVGLGTVAVSTLIPIVYVVKLKPKKVLL